MIAIVLAVMFVFTVQGQELPEGWAVTVGTSAGEVTDSTGYPPLIFVNPAVVADEFYSFVAKDPEGFINWLYANYHVLDMEEWEAIHYEGFLDYGDKIYIKTKGK